EEPDVDDGGSQFDVPHALAADAAVRHLHAAALARLAFVLDAAKPAAAALPILLGAEDALAEQTALLGAMGAVVDGVWASDLAGRPGRDGGGGGEAEGDGANLVEGNRLLFVVHAWRSSWGRGRPPAPPP